MQSVVEHWRTKLAESREQMATGSPHLRWLRAMYLRLYGYLIARYGDEALIGCDLSEPFGAPRGASVQLVENSEPAQHAGAAPKSSGRIRQSLKVMHAASERSSKPGPLAAGLTAGDWITVASERNKLHAGRCRKRLAEHGVACRLLGPPADKLVQVPRGAAEEALRLLAIDRQSLRREPWSRAAHRWLGRIAMLIVLLTFVVPMCVSIAVRDGLGRSLGLLLLASTPLLLGYGAASIRQWSRRRMA